MLYGLCRTGLPATGLRADGLNGRTRMYFAVGLSRECCGGSTMLAASIAWELTALRARRLSNSLSITAVLRVADGGDACGFAAIIRCSSSCSNGAANGLGASSIGKRTGDASRPTGERTSTEPCRLMCTVGLSAYGGRYAS